MKKLLNKIKEFILFSFDQRVSAHAAHASYFIVLGVFPALILLLSLLRYTGLEVETLTRALHGIIPEALFPFVERLILNAYKNTSGAVVSVSLVIALWSASRSFFGMQSGLNAIYGVEESRGYWSTRGLSVLYTFLFLLVLLLTLVLNVFGTTLLDILPVRIQDGPWQVLWEIVDLRFFLLFTVQTGLFTAMFMVLPNRRNSFFQSLPGAVLSSVGWLTFSQIYSIYVERFTGYSNIYGSVYAVALSMLWLYWCISIVFYGAVLNRFLMKDHK